MFFFPLEKYQIYIHIYALPTRKISDMYIYMALLREFGKKDVMTFFEDTFKDMESDDKGEERDKSRLYEKTLAL